MVLSGFCLIFLLEKEETCTIPAGKAIIVPLLTGECHNDGTPPILNDDELRKCAREGDEFGPYLLNSRWRGDIRNLDQYRTTTRFYNLTVVKDNIFDNVPGTFKGNADGFFVFLEPPSPGKHDLRLSTSVYKSNYT